MSAQPRYILTERIAQGGMAEIHLGKSIGSDGFARACAFKKILPHYAQDSDFIQMFRNEAEVAKRLQNRNIVQVFDFVSESGTYMLVMEFVDGQDLRSVLVHVEQAKRRVLVELVVYICIEILNGLAYAHTVTDLDGKAMGIIHRDISPQNVLLSYEGDVKITDFGIAKAQNQMPTTQAGVLKGKFRYMSPEQAQGHAIDARSDLFAVGVIMYEMLTMTRLFRGEDMAVLEAVRQCKIKPPSAVPGANVPAELEAAVMKLLARDPARRYQTAKEAVKDLSRFLYTLKPDFHPGELAEFMQGLFQEKREQSRERIRSTLALPVGAAANGNPFGPSAFPSVASSVPDAGIQRSLGSLPGMGPELARPFLNPNGSPAVAQAAGSAYSPGQDPRNPSANPQADAKRLPSNPGFVGNAAPDLSAASGARLQIDASSRFGNPGNRVASGTFAGGRGRYLDVAPGNAEAWPQPGARRSSSSETLMLLVLGAALVSVAFFGVLWKADVLSFSTDYILTTVPGSGRVKVSVNGRSLGEGAYQNPTFKLSFPMGKYEVAIERHGFKPKRLVLRPGLFGGDPVRQPVVLDAAGSLGSLRVTTVPSGAKVVLDDGKDIGASPYTFEFLPVGRRVQFTIIHPRCPRLEVAETVPFAAERAPVLRNYVLRGCR